MTTFRIDGASSVTKMHFATESRSGFTDEEAASIGPPGRSDEKGGAVAGIADVEIIGVIRDSGIAASGLQELMGTAGRRRRSLESPNNDDSKETMEC